MIIYKRTSDKFTNENIFSGYYKKDGDLQGRYKPLVDSNSEHSEYVNPNSQHSQYNGYDRNTDANSYGHMRYDSNTGSGLYGVNTNQLAGEDLAHSDRVTGSQSQYYAG